MVTVKYFVICEKCKQIGCGEAESGDSDGYRNTFYCSHFRIKILVKTRLGFLFGGNAKVDIYFEPECIAGNHNCSQISHKYWGWANGDSQANYVKCCN